MFEAYFAESNIKLRAEKLILDFLEQYVQENFGSSNIKEMHTDILATVRVLNLINQDIKNTAKEYYQKLVEEKYKNY